MSRLPASRTRLLRVRREAAGVRDGLRLLKGKREALMRAFLECVGERMRAHDRIGEATRRTAPLLAEAAAIEGRQGLLTYGWAARREVSLEARREVVWGVPVATFTKTPLRRGFRERGYDYSGAGFPVNRLADAVEELLEIIRDTAATDVRLKRLGVEIQKTTRRINALEERTLPSLRADEGRIRHRLGEMEREENQRLRRLKARRARSKSAGDAGDKGNPGPGA